MFSICDSIIKMISTLSGKLYKYGGCGLVMRIGIEMKKYKNNNFSKCELFGPSQIIFCQFSCMTIVMIIQGTEPSHSPCERLGSQPFKPFPGWWNAFCFIIIIVVVVFPSSFLFLPSIDKGGLEEVTWSTFSFLVSAFTTFLRLMFLAIVWVFPHTPPHLPVDFSIA